MLFKSGGYMRIRELTDACSKKNVGKTGKGQTKLGFPRIRAGNIAVAKRVSAGRTAACGRTSEVED